MQAQRPNTRPTYSLFLSPLDASQTRAVAQQWCFVRTWIEVDVTENLVEMIISTQSVIS